MTVQEFLAIQLKDSGNQINGVFRDLPPQAWDQKSNPEAMTPRETAIHLLECYQAFLTEAAGNKHEWGSFTPAETSSEYLIQELTKKREEAIEVATKTTDPEILKHASSFIVLHDAYHVGQLATLRLQLGNWDPYSIYQ